MAIVKGMTKARVDHSVVKQLDVQFSSGLIYKGTFYIVDF